MEINKYPRLLIVGTVPYNRQSTSRAFDAYFHNWPHEKIAQIFSNAAQPLKGHCDRLFQITDKMMLNRWFHRNAQVGKEYFRRSLKDETETGNEYNPAHAGNTSYLYRFGTRHTPLTHLLRKVLWRKDYWNTQKFNKWLEEFNPECVFLSFSNDFFILEIALYIAQKFDIPICSSTGDDYYFDGKFSLNPLYYLYHEWYKSLNRRVFRHKGSAIYIGDKIRDKYNDAFGLDGETVYLVSDIQRRPFKAIDPKMFTVRYFGNIRMGRNQSICDVAQALERINPNIIIEVYSNETDKNITGLFNKYKNIKYCGTIPYEEVMRRTLESDILLIVEGTKSKDINQSRYALSTKVADALASGCNIIGYGSTDCGAIEYLEAIGCATVGHSIPEMEIKIRNLINDPSLQKRYYEISMDVYEQNHTLKNSNEKVEQIIRRIVKKYKKNVQ